MGKREARSRTGFCREGRPGASRKRSWCKPSRERGLHLRWQTSFPGDSFAVIIDADDDCTHQAHPPFLISSISVVLEFIIGYEDLAAYLFRSSRKFFHVYSFISVANNIYVLIISENTLYTKRERDSADR